MAPRALKDKQILACKQLYLTNPEGANLSRFLLGKVVSLPRSGRTSYLIEWDRASLNSILPQTSHHLIQTCIGNNDSNRRLIKPGHIKTCLYFFEKLKHHFEKNAIKVFLWNTHPLTHTLTLTDTLGVFIFLKKYHQYSEDHKLISKSRFEKLSTPIESLKKVDFRYVVI